MDSKKIQRWMSLGLLALMMTGGLAMGGEAKAMTNQEAVVLLHGHSRGKGSMKKMARYLTEAGYCVFNIEYPSRRLDVETLANSFLSRELELRSLEAFPRVHVVTHSMGGVLIRTYLESNDLPNLGRVVMLSPPSQGCEIVDRWESNRAFRWWMGPGGVALGTHPDHLPQQLPAVDYPVGVMTGSRSLNWILSLQIPGTDDGKVSVEKAKLAGMTDFRVIPVTHPYIMKKREVMEETVFFLKNGFFEKGDIVNLEHPASKGFNPPLTTDH